MTEQGKRGRGRGTKEEEAREYLQSLNIDPDDLLGAADDEPMPESSDEYVERFRELLWKRRHRLGDTALANMLNGLTRFAEATRKDGGTTKTEPLVADVIAGIVHLPEERKREILEPELALLDAERARIVEVLNAGSADR